MGSWWADELRSRQNTPEPTRGVCPDCHKPWHTPQYGQCTANNAMMLYIPPGEHIHLPCPLHGEHIIYGSGGTY